MRKSVRYALALLLLLVTAVVVLPAVLLDKDDVKQQLSKAAYEATGRELSVGDISVSLLPIPRVTLVDVRFANWGQSAEPWMVEVPTVTVVAAPMDLLSGKITARTVELDSPRIKLEQQGGKNNWDFLPPGKLPHTPIAKVEGFMDVANVLAQAPKVAAIGSAGGFGIAFEKVELRNGQVTLQAAGQSTPLVAQNITVDISAQSMQGPFQIKGKADAVGQTFTLDSIVDEIKPQRAIPLRATVSAASVQWHADGLILRDTGKGLVFKAAVQLQASDIAKSLGTLGVSAPPALHGLPLKWIGDLRADAQKGSLRDGRLTLGTDEVATNTNWNVSGERPVVTMDFHAQHVRLDSWTHAQTASQALPKTFAVLKDIIVKPAHAQTIDTGHVAIPKLPRGVDVNVTAQADVMTWHKQAIHGAVLDMALSGGDVVVNRLAADLPGAASLSVQGFVGTAQKVPSLDLTVDGKAANLRGTLEWLGMDISRVPGDRLRKAGLTMAVALANDGLLHLRDIDMTLDASRARGAANIRLGERPAVGLSLAVDHINVDAYRLVSPVQSTEAAHPIYASMTTASASSSTSNASPLSVLDANVQLSVRRLLAGQQAFDNVRLEGMVQGGDVTIKTATAALGAVGHVSASGRFLQQGQALPLLKDVKIGVKSNRGDRLLRLLPMKLPEFVKSWRNMDATINVDGHLSNVATNALLVVGKTRMHGVGALNLLTGQPAKDTSLTITAPTLQDVAKVFGGRVAPEVAKIGKVTANLPIQRTQTGYVVSNLSLNAGKIKVNGKVDVKTSGQRPFVVADLKGNTLPLVAFAKGHDKVAYELPEVSAHVIPASFTPTSTSSKRQSWMVLRDFDGDLTANFDAVVSPKVRAENVKLAAHLSQGVLDLSKATANVFGGAVSLVGKADLRKQPKLNGKLIAENVAIRKNNPLFRQAMAPVTGVVNLTAEANATGADTQSLLQALNGHGVFKVAQGTFLGADLDEVNRLVQNIRSIDDVFRAIKAGQNGRTVFDDLSGNFNITNGVLRSENVALSAPSGKGAVSGVANLFSRTMDVKAEYALASLKDAPAIGVRLKGLWNDPRVFFDIEAFQGYVLQRGIGQFLNLLGKKAGVKTKTQPQAQPQTDSTSTSTTTQPTETKKKIKVEDVLRGLFNAIPQN